jgi:hypothetical protein
LLLSRRTYKSGLMLLKQAAVRKLRLERSEQLSTKVGQSFMDPRPEY